MGLSEQTGFSSIRKKAEKVIQLLSEELQHVVILRLNENEIWRELCHMYHQQHINCVR